MFTEQQGYTYKFFALVGMLLIFLIGHTIMDYVLFPIPDDPDAIDRFPYDMITQHIAVAIPIIAYVFIFDKLYRRRIRKLNEQSDSEE